MASGTQSDPTYGQPLKTAVVKQVVNYPATKTVLDMYRMVQRTISVSSATQYYTADGDLFHY